MGIRKSTETSVTLFCSQVIIFDVILSTSKMKVNSADRSDSIPKIVSSQNKA